MICSQTPNALRETEVSSWWSRWSETSSGVWTERVCWWHHGGWTRSTGVTLSSVSRQRGSPAAESVCLFELQAHLTPPPLSSIETIHEWFVIDLHIDHMESVPCRAAQTPAARGGSVRPPFHFNRQKGCAGSQWFHFTSTNTEQHQHRHPECTAALYLLLLCAEDTLRLDLLFESKAHLFLLKSSFPLMRQTGHTDLYRQILHYNFRYTLTGALSATSTPLQGHSEPLRAAAYDQRQINCLRHCSVTWKTQTVLLLSNDLCRAPCFRLIFRCVCYLVMKEIMDYSCVKMCILKYIKSFLWTFFFQNLSCSQVSHKNFNI